MFEDLKVELAIAGYMLARTLILVIVNVVGFVLLILAIPHILKWFLWPLI